MAYKFVAKLDEVTSQDVSLAGGKGAQLGELLSAGMPVPEGYVVTTEAFDSFYKKSYLPNSIRRSLRHSTNSV